MILSSREIKLILIYSFISRERERRKETEREREGVVNRREGEKYRLLMERVTVSALTSAYLTHPSNKLFVRAVLYPSPLTFQQLILLSFSINIQDFKLIFSALTNMTGCTIFDRNT